MKIIFNPLIWLALGALVFVTLLIAGTPAESPIAALTFIPCLVMAILTGIGAFGKLFKKWNSRR